MPQAPRYRRLRITGAKERRSMVNSFAALLVDALENSWLALARPKPAPTVKHLVADLAVIGWTRVWNAHVGRMGVRSGGLRTGQENCPRRGDCRRCPRRPGGRRERHSCGRTAMVPAGIRTLETAPDLAERSNRNNV